MVYFYRRRRYRRRPRRYIRRWFRRRFRRYINGSSKSSVRMKTSVDKTISVNAGFGDAAQSADILEIIPYAGSGSPCSMANSLLYKTYCNLYEEVKIVGLKVNVSIVSQVGGTDIPSLQLYTAWDRKYAGTGEAWSPADIKASSTYNVATALNNNVAKIVRSTYASDLMEKSIWIDSSLDPANSNRNAAWYASGKNPTMFHPCMALMLNCPSKAAIQQVSLSLSVTYYLAFRNPKFGGGASSSRLVDLGARSVSFPDEQGDDDDKMSDADALGGAASAAADGESESDAAADADAAPPGALTKRNRSDFSQSAGKQPTRHRKKE